MNGYHGSSFSTSQMQTSSLGATMAVAKKYRGRPKGSKNKHPKAACPLVPCDGGDTMMAPYILEVPHGNDVVRAISQFSIFKNTGLCVLAASGTVANASLRVSSAASAPNFTFPGDHVIISMSAVFGPCHCPTSDCVPKPLTVSLAATNGQVIGGLVFGSLVSVGSVFVIATSFNRLTSYTALPSQVEGSAPNTAAGGEGSARAPSHLPGGGIPMYSAANELCVQLTGPPQPAPSTAPQHAPSHLPNGVIPMHSDKRTVANGFAFQ